MIKLTIVGAEPTKELLAKVKRAMVPAMRLATNRVAEELVGRIKTGLRDQAPGGKPLKPLAKSTILRRRVPEQGTKAAKRGKLKARASTKVLIASGRLGFLGAIARTQISSGRRATLIFVGINRRERTAQGGQMARLAEIHEFGRKPFSIPVTPKMRYFWNRVLYPLIMSRRLKRSTTLIHHPGIPERPFLRPSFEVWKRMEGALWSEWVKSQLFKSTGVNFEVE
jgi:hypothetical protein